MRNFIACTPGRLVAIEQRRLCFCCLASRCTAAPQVPGLLLGVTCSICESVRYGSSWQQLTWKGAQTIVPRVVVTPWPTASRDVVRASCQNCGLHSRWPLWRSSTWWRLGDKVPAVHRSTCSVPFESHSKSCPSSLRVRPGLSQRVWFQGRPKCPGACLRIDDWRDQNVSKTLPFSKKRNGNSNYWAQPSFPAMTWFTWLPLSMLL